MIKHHKHIPEYGYTQSGDGLCVVRCTDPDCDAHSKELPTNGASMRDWKEKYGEVSMSGNADRAEMPEGAGGALCAQCNGNGRISTCHRLVYRYYDSFRGPHCTKCRQRCGLVTCPNCSGADETGEDARHKKEFESLYPSDDPTQDAAQVRIETVIYVLEGSAVIGPLTKSGREALKAVDRKTVLISITAVK